MFWMYFFLFFFSIHWIIHAELYQHIILNLLHPLAILSPPPPTEDIWFLLDVCKHPLWQKQNTFTFNGWIVLFVHNLNQNIFVFKFKSSMPNRFFFFPHLLELESQVVSESEVSSNQDILLTNITPTVFVCVNYSGFLRLANISVFTTIFGTM